VVFVPVGLSYDRVMEDRLLVEARQTGVRRFRAAPLSMLAFAGRLAGQKLRGRFPGFGTAAVSFGAPLSLRRFLSEARTAGTISPDAQVAALGARLMAAVTEAVTVLPVPLVAAALVAGPATARDLETRLAVLIEDLRARDAVFHLPEGGPGATCAAGLHALTQRKIVAERGGLLAVLPGQEALLDFQAAPVLQRLDRGSARDVAGHSAATQKT
jgi:glycerol-3-phosphate O-acyltransferase